LNGAFARAPVRTCLGCRRRQPQRELLRLRWSRDRVVIDQLGRRGPGRGAYVCAKIECWEAMVRRRRLGRALSRDLPASDRIILAAALAGMISNPPLTLEAAVAALAEEER